MVAVCYDGNSTSVTIDNNCNKIRAYAFYGANMQEIIIPTSVVEIGDLAFYQCDELLSLTLHSQITSLGNNILNFCDKVTTLYYNIPNLQRHSNHGDNHIIYNCPLLANIIIGDNVQVISQDLFAYNNSFDTITIPASVTTIEYGAFYSCGGLKTIIFEVGSNFTTVRSNSFEYSYATTVYLTNAYQYNNTNGMYSFGKMMPRVTTVYVLKSVYEDVNNSNAYLTDETKFTQPTGTTTVNGEDYYLFTKVV